MSSPTERLNFLPDFPGRESLYRPLDANKDEIRVITVQPSHERSSAIHCFLQTISIQDGRRSRPYDAISYAWGSTEITDNIVVHDALSADQPDCGVDVPVTYALTGALRQFRAKAAESEKPLVLWTDAVCINQLDAGERSHQVSLMRRVYEAATSVLIWLGEGDPAAEIGLVNLFGLAMVQQATVTDPEHALDAFDHYDYDAEPDMGQIKRVDAVFRNFGKPGGFDVYNCKNVREMGSDMVFWVKSISALLDLSYWYRGWTFQEACVNCRVFLHCGQVRCRVNDWNSLWEFMTKNVGIFKWLVYIRALPAIWDFVSWLHAASSVSLQAEASHHFHRVSVSLDKETKSRMIGSDLHSVARSIRRTTDPRDQVYSQMRVMVGIRFLNLKPDYTLTTEQVFTATTLAILYTSQSWSLSPFITPSESPFMPSWAIDFTLAPDPDISHLHVLFSYGGFNAHSGASFRLQKRQSGNLITAGFIYDEVVTVERCHRQGREATFVGLASAFLQNSLARHLPRNDLWESYSRTLCMGVVSKAQFGPQHAASCRLFFSTEHGPLGDSWPSVYNEMVMRAAFAQRKGMSFIVTRNGHLGMVPSNVNTGDRIAVLAGGHAPFVLRKVGESDSVDIHILVGGCYIDGIMYGEAVHKRARDVYEARRRCDPEFALWQRELRKLISWNKNLGELSFPGDLAFLDDICLV